MGQSPERDFFPDAPNDEQRETPETNDRVDVFMAQNAELFRLSADAWKEVEAAQRSLNPDAIGEDLIELIMHLCYRRGVRPKDSLHIVKSVVRECRAGAYNFCREELWSQMDANASNETNILLVRDAIEQFEARWEAEVIELHQRNSCKHEECEDGEDPTEDTSFKFVKRLKSGYIAAYFLDELAWRRITDGFADPELSSSLLEELYILTEFSPQAAPGFLEIVATRTQREIELKRSQTTLQAAFERATSTYDYAEEFILQALERGPTARRQLYPKEVVGMLAMFELTLTNSPEEFPHSQLAAVLKSPAVDWPEKLPELDQALQRYSNGQTHRAYQEMLAQLEPFMQRGRIPIPNPGRKNSPTPRAMKRRGEGMREIARSVINRPAPQNEKLDEVAQTPEKKQPTTKLAVLKKMTTRTLAYSQVEDLDELIAKSNIGKYIDANPGEGSLEEVIRAAIEFLAENPYDPISTEQIVKGEYLIAGKRRQLRRFSFRTWPDCPPNKGLKASHTRIAYLAFQVDGENYLGIKEIVAKSQVEKGW